MSLKKHAIVSSAPGEKPDPLVAILPLLAPLCDEDLQALRHQIDERLQLDLGTLDLAGELALQFKQGRQLQQSVISDPSVPANQRAQILNSVRGQLTEIIRQQESVWGMERLKKFEIAFAKAALLLTEEARFTFFDLYGQYLKDALKDVVPPADQPPADVDLDHA